MGIFPGWIRPTNMVRAYHPSDYLQINNKLKNWVIFGKQILVDELKRRKHWLNASNVKFIYAATIMKWLGDFNDYPVTWYWLHLDGNVNLNVKSDILKSKISRNAKNVGKLTNSDYTWFFL